MKHRRNLAVAGITAAVVTTALVGTTLPGLVSDRTSGDAVVESVADQNLSDETLVRTDLPEVPSAEEISTSRESQGARDQMMVEIVGRIDQAVDRADELELELMRQHSLAQAQLETAAELQEEAEQATVAAEAALAMDASEEYQEGETSAADVLLGDDDALSQDATDQQLSEQAEREAADSAQLQREADAAAAEAEEAAEAAASALAATGSSDGSTTQSLDELDSVLSELLETLREEEGFEGSLDDFLTYMYGENQRGDGGSGYFDSEGNLDGDAVRERIRQLRAAGPETEVAETEAAAAQTTEDSSDDEEGEAASSEESEVSEADSFDSLDAEQRELLSTGAELEGFEGPADYYRVVLENDALTTGNAVDWEAFANHLAYLESQEAEEPTEEPSASESPSSSPSPTETPSPSPTATASPSPSSSPSPSPTETAAEGYGTLSSGQKSLLAEAAELEAGFDGGARDYYNLILNNDLFTTSGGAINWTVLEGHITYLEEQASASESPSPSPTQSSSPSPSQSPSASPSPTSTPSPTQTPSPSPSQTSNPAPTHWDDLSRELRDLLNEGARLEPGFSGSGGDYWRSVSQNSDLTNSDGTVSTSKLASHVSYLRSQQSSSGSGSSGGGSSSGSGGSSSGGSSSSGSGSSSGGSSSGSSSSGGSSSGGGSQPAGNSGGGSATQIALNWARNEATRSGTSYVLGANGPNAWDCSSFVQAAYRQAGVSLGRTTYQQITQGRQVSWSDRQPGDLIFWGDYHVAIYLGGGMIADAGNPSVGVSVRSVFGNPTSVRRVV